MLYNAPFEALDRCGIYNGGGGRTLNISESLMEGIIYYLFHCYLL